MSPRSRIGKDGNVGKKSKVKGEVLLRKTRRRPRTILRRGSTVVGIAIFSTMQVKESDEIRDYYTDNASKARQLRPQSLYGRQ